MLLTAIDLVSNLPRMEHYPWAYSGQCCLALCGGRWFTGALRAMEASQAELTNTQRPAARKLKLLKFLAMSTWNLKSGVGTDVHWVCARTCRGQQRAWDPPKLEFLMVMSHRVFWELNKGPLQELWVLLAAKSPLQPYALGRLNHVISSSYLPQISTVKKL